MVGPRHVGGCRAGCRVGGRAGCGGTDFARRPTAPPNTAVPTAVDPPGDGEPRVAGHACAIGVAHLVGTQRARTSISVTLTGLGDDAVSSGAFDVAGTGVVDFVTGDADLKRQRPAVRSARRRQRDRAADRRRRRRTRGCRPTSLLTARLPASVRWLSLDPSDGGADPSALSQSQVDPAGQLALLARGVARRPHGRDRSGARGADDALHGDDRHRDPVDEGRPARCGHRRDAIRRRRLARRLGLRPRVRAVDPALVRDRGVGDRGERARSARPGRDAADPGRLLRVRHAGRGRGAAPRAGPAVQRAPPEPWRAAALCPATLPPHRRGESVAASARRVRLSPASRASRRSSSRPRPPSAPFAANLSAKAARRVEPSSSISVEANLSTNRWDGSDHRQR